MTTQTQEQNLNQQEESVLKTSRAQLDFDSDATLTNDNEISEVEKKLLQVPQPDKVSQPQIEQPENNVEAGTTTENNGNLPSLDELDLPAEGTNTEDTNSATQDTLPDTPEAKKFAEDFQKYLGISIEDFKQTSVNYQQTIEFVNQLRAEQYRDRATKTLATDWGISETEVQGRLEQIRTRFAKYPKEMQDRLDGIEGAKLIWAKLEQEGKTEAVNVPSFQRSSQRTGTRPQPMFTQREIDSMSKDEYSRNADRILRAYQLGLVQLS